MKLFVDTTSLTTPHGGIPYYLRQLLVQFHKRTDLEICSGSVSMKSELHKLQQNELKKILENKFIYSRRFLPGRIFKVITLPFLQPFHSKDYDVLFFPGHYCPPHTSFDSLRNAVITIHDMFLWHDIALCDPVWKQYCLKVIPKQAKEAAAIISVSEFSKQEIIKYLDISAEKITVIPIATQISGHVEEHRNPSESLKAKIRNNPFFLAVSTLNKHKNYRSLLLAFEEYTNSKDYAGELLIIVGNRTYGDDEVVRMMSNNPRVLWFQNISQTDLICLYRHAKGFFAVSILEGFGMPLLEAMTLGCPACYSTGNSMDEIGRDAAIKVNPLEIGEICNAFKQLSCSGPEIEKRKQKALEISKEYTWERTAKKTLDVFNSFLKDSY